MSGKRLLAVDGTALAFRAFFAVRGLSDPQGRPTGALYGYITSLLRALDSLPADAVVVAWDRAEPTFRHERSPDYKATRERMDDDLALQLPWMREFTEHLGIPSLDLAGFEADDILATLAHQGSNAGWSVDLYASDKDLAQLVSEKVRLVPPPRGGAPLAPMGASEVIEKFGVEPAQMVDWQAMVGDTSDNVRGIQGVGPKKATALLEKYGALDAVLERGPVEERGKLRENLEQDAEVALLARELVRLRTDVNIATDLDTFRRRPPDSAALASFCDTYGFASLRKELADATEEPTTDSSRDYRMVSTAGELAGLAALLRKADRFAVDTETTSIDPMRARLVGLSFAVQDEQAFYVPLNLSPPLQGPAGEDPLAFLAPLLEDSTLPKIGQNLKYDAKVLARHGVVLTGIVFDTMLAHFLLDPTSAHNLDALSLRYLGVSKIPTSQLLGKGKSQITFDLVPAEDVSPYACEDADCTRRLCGVLEPELGTGQLRRLFDEVEMPLLGVLSRMEQRGIAVDPERLKELSRTIDQQLAASEARLFDLAGTTFNPNSPKQLGPILFERLAIQDEVGVKRVRKTKTGYATNANALERYAGIPIVDTLLEYRALAKLRSTYVDALPGFIHPETQRIHTSFHQAVASTGRLSSSDPNLQNIPSRTELGRAIRAAFVPSRADWVFFSADYSQIELRILAHLASDPHLIEAFRADADIHARTAALVFDLEPDQVDAELRSRAKTINFGVLYGMGPNRLAQQLGIPFGEARDFIEAYFEALPGVREWIDTTLEQARESGATETILGRLRPFPGLHSEDGRVRAAAEREAVNAPIQGSAADLIKVAMLRVDRALAETELQARMLLQVHDELLFEAPHEELPQLEQLVRSAMETVWELDVPLKVATGWGSNWAAAH